MMALARPPSRIRVGDDAACREPKQDCEDRHVAARARAASGAVAHATGRGPDPAIRSSTRSHETQAWTIALMKNPGTSAHQTPGS